MTATKIQDAVSDDLNYETWAPIVKATLTEKGLWDVVENRIPPDPTKNPELAAKIQPEELSKWRDLAVKDMRALQILQSSLTDSVFKKTLSASSAKDVWDLDRVMDLVQESRDLENEIADYEVITKVLGSLSTSFVSVAPLMKRYINLKKTSLNDFLEFFYQCGSLPGKAVGQMLKDSFESKQSKQRRGDEDGGGEEVEDEYLLFSLTVGDFKYDEDMWMIHTTTVDVQIGTIREF